MLDSSLIVRRTKFNVNDFSHRKAVANFNKTGKWEMFFEVPQGCKNLPYTLSNEILEYYVAMESQYSQHKKAKV